MSDRSGGALLRGTLVKALVAALLLVGAWKLLPVDIWVQAFLGVVASMGIWGPLVYGLVYVVAGTLGVPRTPLNIGAGVTFGLAPALAVVMVSAALTFAITFGIARHVAGDWVGRKIDAIPNGRRIMEAVDEEGFKLVLLLRMNPFLPAVIKGYGFGTTNLKFAPYLLASVLGFLPIGLAHVYLGWAGGQAMLTAGGQPPGLHTAVLIGGVVVSLLLVGLVAWLAHRSIHKRTSNAAAAPAAAG